jgi:DNA polymerase III delta prime subunit
VTKLTLSEQSEANVALLQKSLPQSILLTGPNGVGLKTIALHIGEHNGQTIVVAPTFLTKKSTVAQISIERIRELYEETRTASRSNRIVIIDDADAMTLAAQNAFLKLLEEPNSSTFFILTSHHPELLLPTIRSRVETYRISPVDNQRMESLFSNLPTMTAQKKAQLAFIAAELPAELHRLASDEQLFRRRAAQMSLAKQLLEATSYKRTALLHQEKLDRSQALKLVDDMIAIIMRNPTPESTQRISQLIDCTEALSGGGNIKLHLIAAVV